MGRRALPCRADAYVCFNLEKRSSFYGRWLSYPFRRRGTRRRCDSGHRRGSGPRTLGLRGPGRQFGVLRFGFFRGVGFPLCSAVEPMAPASSRRRHGVSWSSRLWVPCACNCVGSPRVFVLVADELEHLDMVISVRTAVALGRRCLDPASDNVTLGLVHGVAF